jgi:CBS domain-containing protein
MSSLFVASNWPFLAVILLSGLLLLADACSRRTWRREDDEEEPSPLEEQLQELQYLHTRIREEEFRRAMFEQHQAMLDRQDSEHEHTKLGILVEHLMTTRVLCLLPDTCREDVVAAMESIGSRHLIVCDERDRLLGVISDRDLNARDGQTAGQIMTPSAHSVSPRASTAHALALMFRHRISCLPVVDQREQLVGVLTTSDLLLALSCYLELSAMVCGPPPSARGWARSQAGSRSLRQITSAGKPSSRKATAPPATADRRKPAKTAAAV